MTIKRPRLQVTLSRELKDTLKELSDLTSTPSSQIASNVLEEALPVFKEILLSLRVAEQNQDKALEMVKDSAYRTLGASGVAVDSVISDIEKAQEELKK